MSAIFVLVAVTMVLLIGAIAIGAAAEDVDDDGVDNLLDIIEAGLSTAEVVPIILIVALVVAVLSVWGRL